MRSADSQLDYQRGESDAEVDRNQDYAEPPDQYYRAAIDLYLSGRFQLAGDDAPQLLFLDFDGAEVRKGFRFGESFIPCANSISIPNSNISPTRQQLITERVREHFDAQRVNISVVTSKPVGEIFTTIIVGGLHSDLGCSNSSRNILGIAPLDRGNTFAGDIGFVFSATLSGSESILNNIIADAIAHEAGHSFGLEHIENTSAIMNPAISRLVQGFGVGRIVGSNGSAASIQDSGALLRTNLGEARSFENDDGNPNDDNGDQPSNDDDTNQPNDEEDQEQPDDNQGEDEQPNNEEDQDQPNDDQGDDDQQGDSNESPPQNPDQNDDNQQPDNNENEQPDDNSDDENINPNDDDSDFEDAFHNPNNPLDVNGDQCVTAIDILQIINFIRRNGQIALTRERRQGEGFVDVDGDGRLTIRDAILVIRTLIRDGARCNR